MHDKNKDTKKVSHNLGNIFKMSTFWQYCQGPYFELNQKSMVELFLQKYLTTFSCKFQPWMLDCVAFKEKKTNLLIFFCILSLDKVL